MPAAASDTRGGLDSLHFTVGSSADYSTVLSSLLMTNATTPSFAPFPAAGGNVQPVGNLPARTLQPTTVVPPQGLTLSFTGPSTVVSGGSVGVSATVNAPHVVTSVLFVGPGFSQVDTTAPFGVTVPIPLTALGAFPISAAASSNGSPIISNTVTAQVSAPAALQGVEVDPADVLITGLGNTLQLTVQGW